MAHFKVDMKPLIRISKSGVRNIIGKMLDYSEKYEYTYKLETNQCLEMMKCPIAKEYEELRKKIIHEKMISTPDMSVITKSKERMNEIASSCAASGCAFCHVTKKYLNDKKRYNLYNETYANRRLPKSMIRTYLYLYSLPQEVLGGVHFIRDLSVDILSSELGLCKETVKKSIETLSAFHYITVSHSSCCDTYHIIINEYDTMHLPAAQGGTGYFTITSEMMKQILSISNVNALRLEVLKLLKSDEDSFQNIDASEYKINDLKNIMPSHANYPALYKKVCDKQPSLFHSDINNGKLHFTLKNGYSLRINSTDFMMEFKDDITTFTMQLGMELSFDEIMNICELTREFTISNIKISLYTLYNDYKDRIYSQLYKIRNLGALLRTYCRKNFINHIA